MKFSGFIISSATQYVGNRSNNVLYRLNLNGGMVLGAGINGQPFYTSIGKTAQVENPAWEGKTRCNGLQMKLDRRFRGGWLVTNSYPHSCGPCPGSRTG